MHGALQHLLVLPDRAWSDRELASYHAKQFIFKLQERRATTTLATISCAKTTNGSDGKIQFSFTGGVLDVDEGSYEGEIIVSYNGNLQTVYDVLKFRVRSNF